jgi:hypothetical protein
MFGIVFDIGLSEKQVPHLAKIAGIRDDGYMGTEAEIGMSAKTAFRGWVRAENCRSLLFHFWVIASFARSSFSSMAATSSTASRSARRHSSGE